MPVTDTFSGVINAHLQSVADKDPLFAATFKKQNKNLTDCTNYILNQVKKTGKQGFDDAEIFAMAVHYYDEDDIKPGANISANVIVKHSVAGENKTVHTQKMEKKAVIKTEKVKSPVSQMGLF